MGEERNNNWILGLLIWPFALAVWITDAGERDSNFTYQQQERAQNWGMIATAIWWLILGTILFSISRGCA